MKATDQNDLPGAVNDSVPDESDSDVIGSSAASSAGKREKALAFTVPGDEDRDPSLIRRHPPLRFRKLEDQQVEISQEMINMKQAEAEKRRSAVSLYINVSNRKPKILIKIASVKTFLVDHSRESKIREIFQCTNAKFAQREGLLPHQSRGVCH